MTSYGPLQAWYEFIVFCILVISGIILAIIQYACTCARCKEIKPVTSVLYGSGRCLRQTDVCCDHFFSSEHCCMISCHHYQQKKDPAKALCKGCELPPGACEQTAVSCFCDSHDKYKLQAIEDVELCDVLCCNNDKDKYPQYQKKTTCDFFTLLCWGWKPREAKFQKLLLEAMTHGDPDRETYCADQVCSWLSGFRCFRFITSGGAAFFIFVYSIYVRIVQHLTTFANVRGSVFCTLAQIRASFTFPHLTFCVCSVLQYIINYANSCRGG